MNMSDILVHNIGDCLQAAADLFKWGRQKRLFRVSSCRFGKKFQTNGNSFAFACQWRHFGASFHLRARKCISATSLVYCGISPFKSVIIAQWQNECISLSILSEALVRLPFVAECFPGCSHNFREVMGAAKSSLAHWKDTRNAKQNSFLCP